MKVAVYQSWEELQPLVESWNATLAASSSDTVFLTWEWCEAWWKNYGAGRPLFVMAAWEGGALIGVAPFYLARMRKWGTTCTCLRVIGDGSNDADYLDCFILAGREHEVVGAFLRVLEDHRGQWDLIEISGVPQESVCLSALAEYAAEREWRVTSEPIGCAVVALPKTWDEYLENLQPRFRTKVRSSLGQMQQYLGSVPTQCVTPDEVQEWLPGLFELHSRRWEHDHQPGVFRDSAKRSFYHDVSRAALKRGWLSFHRLDWGERPLAFQYGFRYRNRFFLLQEGYDPAFEALRPGFALRSWLMRHWIEQGVEEYDFLAGTAPQKMSWGAKEKKSVRLLVATNRRSQWAAIQAPLTCEEVKETIATLAPPQLLAWQKEVRIRRAQARFQPDDVENTGSSNSLFRRMASHLYTGTPLGNISRKLATRYTWDPAKHRVSRRSVPTFQIFIYHRVNDNRDPFLYATPVSQFRAQMEHLARNFHLVTLDQIAQGEFPSNGQKHCVAVTFDDGYRDNFLYAFPILKELGIPATIFLATGYIDSQQLPWYDQVCLAFKLTLQPRLNIPEIGEFSLQTQAARLQALQRTLDVLRSANESNRFQLLGEVFQQLRVPGNLNLPNFMLTWDEIRRMSKQGMSFGAHTVTHPVLASLSGGRLREEILGSKKTVENRLQLSADHFAYPFGKPADVGTEAKGIVQAAGFRSAVTTVYGVNDPAQDRFELKRFCLVEADVGMFGLKLDWNRMSDSPAAEHHHEARQAGHETVHSAAGLR